MNTREKTNEPPVREFIALHLMNNLGAKRIRLLLQSVEHPRLIFRLERHELESIRGIGPVTAGEVTAFNEWQKVDRIIAKTERIGAEIMTYWDDDYPRLLREIYDPPLLLWIMGDRKILNTAGLAIVGTRKAGRYALAVARKFARELAEHELTIVSGLAYGVDGAAHKATVEQGGKTVAVLGSGIDWIYPKQHRRLASQIIRTGGAVISEFPPGTAPQKGNFPVRNRIVSGMTLGTLVVASGLDGGSMITAKSALDQNREVFVIPYPVGHPNAIGCNSLIKRGMGKLVQNVRDILVEIKVHLLHAHHPGNHKKSHREKQWRSRQLDRLGTRICKILEGADLHIDLLAEQLEMETHQLMPKLLELEMAGCIRQTAGKNFELK